MDNRLTKSYKAVFIDWDDTIGDFVGAAKRALRDMYEKYNLSDYFDSHEEFVSLYKPHNIELWDKYGKDLVTKDYLSLDRFLFPLMHGSKTIKNFELGIKNHSVLFELARKMSDDIPVYLEDGEYSQEEYTLILQCLEKRGLIDIDYSAPLKGFDTGAYAAYPIRGSFGLTARGLVAAELLEYLGVE